MAGETILFIDDDDDMREIIPIYLEREGYHVFLASDGNQGISEAISTKPDLIILDMMLPDLDGIDVCQEIRKTSYAPIIFLSCKSTPFDKSIGLAAGGDDYMGKPFDVNELLARVKAQLRRNRMLDSAMNVNKSSNLLYFPDLTMDLSRYTVEAYGKDVFLSPKEFQLLALLAQTPNVVHSNETLYNALWGTDSLGDYRTVMVHISNIRKKIEKDPKNPVYIHTVKGVGYKFSMDS